LEQREIFNENLFYIFLSLTAGGCGFIDNLLPASKVSLAGNSAIESPTPVPTTDLAYKLTAKKLY